MPDNKPVDVQAAHRHFSATCFNRAWELIRTADRTPEQDDEMVELAHVSFWHWTQRPDCEAIHRSIGTWQLARVYALVGEGPAARQFANRCLAISQDLPAFYRGYAHEALARAALVDGRRDLADEQLALAEGFLDSVTDPEERSLLAPDLEQLKRA